MKKHKLLFSTATSDEERKRFFKEQAMERKKREQYWTIGITMVITATFTTKIVTMLCDC